SPRSTRPPDVWTRRQWSKRTHCDCVLASMGAAMIGGCWMLDIADTANDSPPGNTTAFHSRIYSIYSTVHHFLYIRYSTPYFIHTNQQAPSLLSPAGIPSKTQDLEARGYPSYRSSTLTANKGRP